MFRPVRKKANEISVEEAKKLLHEARRGVLAVSGDDGYPYAVPINYLYDEDAQEIIFHGSKVGHKVDALKRSDKVCFTVVSGESVEIEDEAWAPFLKSAVVFGRCYLVADRGESDALCKKFAMKYYPTEKMVDGEVAPPAKPSRCSASASTTSAAKRCRRGNEKRDAKASLFHCDKILSIC